METRKPTLDLKRNTKDTTKLLVRFPFSQRLGLAELSAVTGQAQQELIRRAVAALLDEHFPGRAFGPAPKDLKAVVAPAMPQPEPVEPERAKPARPPQPSPNHAWVATRNGGGYWRAKRAKKSS
jgi:hypothetical protein